VFVTLVSTVLAALGIYLVLGVLFAVAFHAMGAARVDPAVSGGGFFFRALITPGVVALWPLLALRWRKAAGGAPMFGAVHTPVSSQGLRTFHRRLSLVLLLIVPTVALAGIVFRPGAPPVNADVRSTLPEPAPLPTVAATIDDAFPVAMTVRLRSDDGQSQVELEIPEDVGLPALALYWTPDGVDAFPRSAISLGAVWGPGTRRYMLPRPAANRAGTLVLYSMATGETIGSHSIASGN
jgi:hypothetical protein